jgi:hypothetical protein
MIWNRLKSGKVVPFLGAGASFVARPADGNLKWNPENPEFLPSGLDLAHLFADEALFPASDPRDRDDLAKVASYYADIGGRRALRERLREVLNHPYPYGPLHEFLAAVPHPLLIVSTNYDTLTEQAFRAAARPYDLVVYPADQKEIASGVVWWPHGEPKPRFKAPNELDIDLSQTTVLYKMHGTILRETDEWDSFVITEEDYVEFLSRMIANAAVPAIFYRYFRERSFLFLGYGLRDWNLRVVLKNISKHLTSRRESVADGDLEVLPSWAIQYRPSELERKLWEKRNVTIFDIAIDDFVASMLERAGLRP